MTYKVKVGDKFIGEGEPCYIIGEIGINHNGSLDMAKRLIDNAVRAGCDAVKFQKRTIEVVYTKEELAKERNSVFGTTNGDLKRGLEFGYKEYSEIDKYCKEKNIQWLMSCWDEQSVDFAKQFDIPAYKIASASLTDDDLLRYTRNTNKPIFLSTGMSTMEEIYHAVSILGEENLVIMHCTSTYPTDANEINLNVIPEFMKKFNTPIGYSGHERGISPSVMSVVLGACAVERHITLDRTLWGSDQAASLELEGISRMVRDIRQIPTILGDGKKVVYDNEKPIIKKLRRNKTIDV